MKQKRYTGGALAMLIILVVARVAAAFVWQQVNANGFGDPQAEEVSAVESFSNYLYAGTSNPMNSARIFRSPDAVTWTPVIDPGFGNPHDTAPPAILDLTVFSGRLYASTGRGNAAQIWRTANGLNWAPVVAAGFGDPDIVDISVLAEYGGLIYAGVTHAVTGAQIWRSYTGDSNSWEKVAPAVAGTDVATVTGLAAFDGALYAAVTSDAPPQIWRSYGGPWSTIVNDGFGDSHTTSTGGMAAFMGALYVGAGSAVDGAQIWRSNDGTSWEQVIDPGFGDANNEKVASLFVFQHALYAGVQNTAAGMEVWRSADGALWEQVNDDGFGDGNNTGTNVGNATTNYLGHFYVGTSNVADGGELWQMAPDGSPLYGVELSPDETLAGLPGTTVTYTVTITNSGNITDTFDLALTGNVWPTTLSTSSTTLAAGAGATFTVAVSIPPGAPGNSTDSATLTATSRGDVAMSDSAILSTTCLGPQHRLYLPLVFRNS